MVPFMLPHPKLLLLRREMQLPVMKSLVMLKWKKGRGGRGLLKWQFLAATSGKGKAKQNTLICWKNKLLEQTKALQTTPKDTAKACIHGDVGRV